MRHSISGKKVKELNSQLEDRNIPYHINKKKNVEILYDKDVGNKIILIDNAAVFFYYKDLLIPTLRLLNREDILKTAAVDMPAIKFITNGADIMRPGITHTDDFNKDDIISIVDEVHNKPIAVGKALFSSKDIISMNSGKVIKNIHYIGDNIWKAQEKY